MTESVAAPRRPWLAALLNLLIPGLGHLYAGASNGAAVWFFLPVVALIIVDGAVLSLPPSVLLVLLFWGIPLGMYILQGVSGWRAARRAAVPFAPTPLNHWYWYLGFAAVSGILYSFVVGPYVRAHFVQAFRIPSEGMSPTLIVGDFVIMDRRATTVAEFHVGDLVAFRSVEEPELQVLKRVAGVAGDTLQMKGGALIRNWVRQEDDPFYDSAAPQPLDAPRLANALRWQIPTFAGPVPRKYTPDPSNWGPIVVPSGHFFTLGDNRNQSWDSRDYGFVPDSSVVGRPRLIFWNKSFADSGMFARVGTAPK